MRDTTRQYLKALSRAFAGAIIFGIPIMMTMEMWALGATLERVRLAAFLGFVLPLLVGLAYLSGFEKVKGRLQVDRKSTRLNSSHVKSSYAVCCLKKKMRLAI